jgi:sodium-dependent dicarboxylate transporter 2/3/5
VDAEAGAKLWKRFGLVAGPLAFALLAFVPSGLHRIEGFGHRPAYAAAVAAWMAVWWFTEAVPISWTSCLRGGGFPATGVFGKGFVRDSATSVEPFLDAYIFLFMGGMAIGAAMEAHGLHRRIALHIMRAIGTEPRRLLLGMLVATAVVSMWISNTATAVMMVPIAMALLAQLQSNGERLHHFGAAIMLSVAYGANVGGIGTKIGTTTNSIFTGFVSEKLGYDLDFLRFLAVGLPFVVLFLPLVWWVLWRMGRHDAPAQAQARDVLDRELAAMGRLSKSERVVAVVFGAAALLWIGSGPIRQWIAPFVPKPWEGFKFQGKHYEAYVAVAAALVLVATRVLSWAAIKRVPWGTLLLLGGSFAMASGIEGSGLSGWLGLQVKPIAELPLVSQLALGSAATVGLSAIASNTATINLMLNLLPASLPLLSSCAIAASCDFALPAGTPPNAIVFGSGYIRLPVMMRIGLLLDFLAVMIITAYGLVYLPLLFP